MELMKQWIQRNPRCTRAHITVIICNLQVEEVSKHGWTKQKERKIDDAEDTDEESFVM